MRNKTRHERYLERSSSTGKLPVSVATINLRDEINVGLVVRAAACFGAVDVHVIGALPSYADLKRTSGGTCDFVDIKCYSHPQKFVEQFSDDDVDVYAAEIMPGAKSIFDVTFDFLKQSIIVIGHETMGVPIEILKNSDIVEIPMFGPGYCLNASQAANVFLFEFTRQLVSAGGSNA